MGKILKHSVVVRRSLNGYPETFKEGEELPDELIDLVGEHLFEGYTPPKEEGRRPGTHVKVKTGLPSEGKKKSAPEKGVSDEMPGRSASKASWQAYADRKGIKYPEDAGRDDIIALVDAKFAE